MSNLELISQIPGFHTNEDEENDSSLQDRLFCSQQRSKQLSRDDKPKYALCTSRIKCVHTANDVFFFL